MSDLPHSCPNCGASMTGVGRLESLLVERDGEFLSYGQLRERLLEAEALASRQQAEIERLLDERDEARLAARCFWMRSLPYFGRYESDIYPWMEVSDERQSK